MRRTVIALISLGALVLAACSKTPTPVAGSSTPPASATSSPSASPSGPDCSIPALHLITAGQLTIGTDNPAYPPYFEGGAKKGSGWDLNDPNNDKGFESAVAYAMADKLGFSKDQVKWVVAPFAQTYKPGPKQWDFAIEQISYSAKRAKAVDFSGSYYDVNQALVANKGTPITSATSLTDLKNYTLAAPIGTTSYDYIVNTIQPTKEPGAYNSLSDTVAALNAGQVAGIVVDLPTALFLADPYVLEVKKGVVVGQFPTSGSTSEYFGVTFEKGNPLVACVNRALDAMKADGTLQSITTEWLSVKTNVGTVPVFTP
jgi:polar amino acid transport system substrate-binding protein